MCLWVWVCDIAYEYDSNHFLWKGYFLLVGSPHCDVANMLDYDIVVSVFNIQSRLLRSLSDKQLEKGMNSLAHNPSYGLNITTAILL